MTKRQAILYKDHFSYDLCNQFIFTNEWLVRHDERKRETMRMPQRERDRNTYNFFLGIEFICCYLFT